MKITIGQRANQEKIELERYFTATLCEYWQWFCKLVLTVSYLTANL